MKSRRQRLWQTGGLAALGLLLAACSGGGSGGSAGTSTLTVSLMDTPLAAVDNVTEVNVEIAAIWLKPAGSDAMRLPLTQTPMKVNLLALTDEHPALLIDGATVPAGDYEWLALDVNATFDGKFDSYVALKSGGQEFSHPRLSKARKTLLTSLVKG